MRFSPLLFLLPSIVHSFSFYQPISSTSLTIRHQTLSLSKNRLLSRRGEDNDYDDYEPNYKPLRKKSEGRLRLPESVTKALLAGVFVLGIGTGVTLDSAINTNEKDLASRDAIDKNAPNPTLCTSYGASAMAFDQRVFVSFNPFNVYVSQADVKPACVLRQSNAVNVLQTRGLLNNKEVKSCKSNLSNTWAFVGDLSDRPQLSCVYQSEDAQNEFLSDPKRGIGEDVYDDDRAMEAAKKSTKKRVKNALSGGQKDMEGVARMEELKQRGLEMMGEETETNEDAVMN